MRMGFKKPHAIILFVTPLIDRDLRDLFYSEEEAKRRLQSSMWRRLYLPMIASLVIIAGLTILAGMAYAGGLSALAGAAAIYLALSGFIIGIVLFATGLFLVNIISDISIVILHWTTRARGISALISFRIRSISDGVARILIRASGYFAVAEAGYQAIAKTTSSALSAITRKHNG
jgi:hypothetical protein